MRNLVIQTDERHSLITNIKSDIDNILFSAQATSDKRVIRLDEERDYVHIEDYQYTGLKVL